MLTKIMAVVAMTGALWVAHDSLHRELGCHSHHCRQISATPDCCSTGSDCCTISRSTCCMQSSQRSRVATPCSCIGLDARRSIWLNGPMAIPLPRDGRTAR